MNENASVWEGEDVELLAAVVQERDPDAYRALFDRYYPRIFVFVQRRVGDSELSREITSDVFLEVWNSADKFRGESKISSWIFGIARFKSLEAIRRRGRFKRSRVVSTEDDVIAQVPDGPGPATQLDARESLRRVQSLLPRLPRDQREALEWTVIEGLPIDDVARRQGVSRDTVKTRVSRARRELRRLLGMGNEGETG